ncbi:MAG: superoxide dismutase [Mangrovibacterium sp.]
MAFELPKLPYGIDSLEPYISGHTLEFHYGKHHQAYVNNLNGLVAGTEFEQADLETIIKKSSGAIFNNAAQVWNHTFYFFQFSQSPKAMPTGKLMAAIEDSFGSFDAFKDAFTKSASTVFGSGWAWLVKDNNGKLSIVQTSNAGNPLTDGLTPLMTCDVWEHAYYIDKQNARAKYIEDFWHVLNWQVIEERF